MSRSEAERKALFARKDLVDRLSEVAGRRGCSLYSLVNEVFEVVLKAEDAGVDLRRVVERESLLEVARRTGYVLVLEGLLYEMTELAYRGAGDQALRSWFEAGVWLAKRYTTSDLRDPVEAFLSSFKSITWNASELSMRRDGEGLYVRVVNPKAPEPYSTLLAAFLEGALNALGYRVVGREVSRGFLRLEAVRREAGAYG